MKEKIKFIFKYLFLLACAIIIIYFLPKSPANAQFQERHFVGTGPVEGRGKYWFNDMIAGAAYLCAEHGATFFNEGETTMDIYAEWTSTKITIKSNTYHKNFSRNVDGLPDDPVLNYPYKQHGPILLIDLVSYAQSAKDLKTDTYARSYVCVSNLTYSGDHRFQYASQYELNANGAHIYTIGETKYTPKTTSHEENNAIAYILSYCDPFNAGVAPRNSQVNVAFWNHLGQGGSASTLGLAGAMLPTESQQIQDYLYKLEQNQNLSNSELNTIKTLANNYLSTAEYRQLQTVLNNYKANKNNSNKKKLKEQLNLISQKIYETTASFDIDKLYNYKYQLNQEVDYLNKSNLNYARLSNEQLNDINTMINQYLTGNEKTSAVSAVNSYKNNVIPKKGTDVINNLVTQINVLIKNTNNDDRKEKLKNYRKTINKNQAVLEKSETDNISTWGRSTLKTNQFKSLQNALISYMSNSYKPTNEEIKQYKTLANNVLKIVEKLMEKAYQDNKNQQSNVDAANLIQKANEFGAMWQQIREKYGGSYENSIKDKTVQENIKVVYNSETKKYKVGPFRIDYLKSEHGDTQFGGMTGTPILTLRNNNKSVLLSRGDKWKIVKDNLQEVTYPDPLEEFYVLLDYTEGFNAITAIKFDFKYLTAEADYTISEGNIEKLDWHFYEHYSDDAFPNICFGGSACDGGASDNDNHIVDSLDSEKEHDSEVACANGKKPHFHESATKFCTNHASCGGHIVPCNVNSIEAGKTCSYGVVKESHYKNADGTYTASHSYSHSYAEMAEAGCSYWKCTGHACKGGKSCEHMTKTREKFYFPHFAYVVYDLDITVIGYENIQDTASVASANVYVNGVNWWINGSGSGTLVTPPTGEGDGTPGQGGGSLELHWYIDLTTSIAGDVWEDIDAQKNNNVVTGTKDSEEAGSGIKNIAVTVKLYDQNGKFVNYAIPHDKTGAIDIEQSRKDVLNDNEKQNPKYAWPKYTDDNGHYEINRLEAPGITGNQNKLFYVVEFEYDGQVYKHTVYMADSDHVTDNIASEGKSSDYTTEKISNSEKIKADKYKNSSMAVETVQDRYDFDQSFGEITGNSSIKSDNSTDGKTKTTNENGAYIQSNNSNKDVYYRGKNQNKLVPDSTGSTKIMESTLESPYTDEQNSNGRKPAKVTNVDSSATKEKYKRYRMVASTFYNYDGNTNTLHGVIDNADVEDFRIKYPLEGWQYVMNNKKSDTKRYIADYMLHINLGLQKRRETDISILEDLYKITLVVNGQKVTREVDSLKNKSDYNQQLFDLEANRATGSYTLGLYKSDVDYKSSNLYQNAINAVKELKRGTELRVFVTYKTKVFNNSETNDVEINEITNYYDPTFTLLNSDIKASIVNDNMKLENDVIADSPYYRIISRGTVPREYKPTKAEDLEGYANSGNVQWNVNFSNENKYKVAKLSELTDKKLKIGESVEIFTTYEIDQEGYNKVSESESMTIEQIEKAREKLFGTTETNDKYNITEISNYSTYYSKENDKANYYTGYNFEKGWISGRVDRDSAPNNIDRTNMLNRDRHEDDTYQANVLHVGFKEHEREMYGYVWEDKKNEGDSIKVGNGVHESGEPLVKNVKVSMYEVINLTGYENKPELAGLEYYYKLPEEYYWNVNSTKTPKEGTAITEDKKVYNIDKEEIDGNYYLYGFLAGDYVLRFDYGTESDEESHENWDYSNEGLIEVDSIKYNGQDYENTRFLGEYIKNDKDHLNDKYLDLKQEMDSKAISKARDNESRRMVVDAYSRNIENERGEILRNRNAANTEFIEATKMFAETPVMQIEIEDPKQLTESPDITYGTEEGKTPANIEKTDKTGNPQGNIARKYIIKNINFGLEKRADTDIVLEQYINKIVLVKDDSILFTAEMRENGEVITNSSDAQNLDKLTYMAHDTAKNQGQQGFYALNIENEFLNGLSLCIQYKIRVINNSEVDFTGFLAGQYTKDSIEKLASRTPTTALYNSIIDGLKAEGDEGKPNETGISSNGTLKELLGDSQLKAELKTLLGLAADKNQETDTIRPEVIIYGKYVGRFYYENKLHDSDNDNDAKYTIVNYSKDTTSEPVTIQYAKDQVVKTTVDELIDYIDVNTSLDVAENTNIENSSWILTGITKNDRNVDYDKNDTEDAKIKTLTDLDGLISDSTYRAIGSNIDLYDNKGRQFVTDTGSNIAISYNENIVKDENNKVKYKGNNSVSSYNNNLTTALTPKNYDSGNSERTIYVATRKNVSSDMEADEMLIDNLVEILVYSNPTGRRDVNSVPGNALVIGTKDGMWAAGYGARDQLKLEDFEKLSESISIDEWWEKNKTNWRAYPENDAYTTEYVTVVPPTGIAMHEYIKTRIVPIIVLMTAIVTLSGVFIVKQKKLRRNV